MKKLRSARLGVGTETVERRGSDAGSTRGWLTSGKLNSPRVAQASDARRSSRRGSGVSLPTGPVKRIETGKKGLRNRVRSATHCSQMLRQTSHSRRGSRLSSPRSGQASSGFGAAVNFDAVSVDSDDGVAEEKQRRKALLRKCGQTLMRIGRAGIFIKAAGWSNKDRMRLKSGDADQLQDLWRSMAKARATQGQSGEFAGLPEASEMQHLPGYIRKTFRHLAMEALRSQLYPRACLWIFRKRKKALLEIGLGVGGKPGGKPQPGACPAMTLDILMSQAMFREWPRYAAEQVLDLLRVEAFLPGEVVMHEKEPGTCIFFLMAGRCEVLKRSQTDPHGRTDKKSQELMTLLNPVAVIGEFSILTEEPRLASIRAREGENVFCQVLRRSDLMPLLNTFPPQLFNQIIGLSFEARNKNMIYTHPMTTRAMRAASPILQPCSDEILRMMMAKLTPYCVPRGVTICKSEQAADSMFFLRSGRCGVMRTVVQRKPSDSDSDEGPSEQTHVRTLSAPDNVGVVAVLQCVNFGDTIQTLTTADFWKLHKDDFDQATRADPTCMQPMQAAARDVRRLQLEAQQNLYRQSIYKIPILKTICTRDQMRELVNVFTARLYKPLSTICSTSDVADRIVVLYKGRVRVGHSGRWTPGEAVGFTCVVTHRWAEPAVTSNVGECLELGRNKYEAFLRRHNLYDAVCTWVTALMFPFAPSSRHPDVAIVKDFVADQRTPPMHPTSESPIVNWNLQGFGNSEPKYLELRRRREEVEMLHAQQQVQQQAHLLSPRNAAGKGRRKGGNAAKENSDDLEVTRHLRSELNDILSRAPPEAARAMRSKTAGGRRFRPRPYDWFPPEASQEVGGGDRAKASKKDTRRRGDDLGELRVHKDESRYQKDDRRGLGVRLSTTQVWRLGGTKDEAIPQSAMMASGHYPPTAPRGTLYPLPDPDFGAPISHPYFRWYTREVARPPSRDDDPTVCSPPRRTELLLNDSRDLTRSRRPASAVARSTHWYTSPLKRRDLDHSSY
eukprot:Hpha_TRINITY_DN13201_c0_g2::TRINITY_DN13201_c0_g2_i1::g.154829::m.154829